MKMTIAELMCAYLEANDITNIFGVPGYAISPLFLATRKFPKINPVLTRHESGAGWCAYGYAASGNKFGVCLATSGAGATNIISGIVSAYYNSMPVLVITGQVETEKLGLGAFQELSGKGVRNPSIQELFKPYTILNETIETVSQVLPLMARVHYMLTSNLVRKGPIHLSIPINILKQTVEVDPARLKFENMNYQSRLDLTPQMHKLSQFLKDAKHPLILVGRGFLKSAQSLKDCLDLLKIPFCTTIQGKNVIAEDHPLHLGILGIAGSPKANHYFTQYVDKIVVLGSSLNEFTSLAYHPSLQSKKIFRVDLDIRESTKTILPDELVIADSASFCDATLRYFVEHPPFSTRLPSEVVHLDSEIKVTQEPQGLSPLEIVKTLQKHMPENAIVTADSGNNAVWVVHYLKMRASQQFIIDINTGCMGSGVVSAIGAKLANPHKPVISICGDGGFMMNGADIATAADLKLRICWFVFNDQKLGMVVQGDTNKYGATVASTFANAEIIKWAEALGADACMVQNVTELEDAIKTFEHSGTGPMVVDIRFDDTILPKVYARVEPKKEDEALKNSLSMT